MSRFYPPPHTAPVQSMPKPFNPELRERIAQALEQEPLSSRVGEQFGVSASFVRKLRVQLRNEGSILPKRGGRRHYLVAAEHESSLRDIVAELPQGTLRDIGSRLRERTGIDVSVVTVWRTLRRLGIATAQRRDNAA
jgi:transposase